MHEELPDYNRDRKMLGERKRLAEGFARLIAGLASTRLEKSLARADLVDLGSGYGYR
ncbi:MAG: hypothetical protein H5U40_09745, partial [Polyangiaceae bacterium]|nr:hypothetical protein [Polyangiaceae bacterium]